MSAAGVYFLSLRTPTGIPAGRGPGRLLHLGAIAGRRLGHPHQRGGQAHRGAAEVDAAGPERFRDRRVFDHRRRQRAECGLHRPDPEAVRRSRRRGKLGAGADREVVRRGTADPHRDRHPVQPAANHRTVDHGRVRIRARRARRAGAGGDEQRHARAARGRQPRPAADPRLLDLYRQQSVDLPRYRPREGAGAGPRHERRVRRPASDAGRHLHQQLQPVRPGLAGQYRGRRGGPQRRLLTVADLHSQQIRHRRAAAIDRQCPRRRRAAGHHPLQQLPRDSDSGQPVAGHLVRHRARRDGAGLGQDLARRLRLRMDRDRLPGGLPPPGRPGRSWVSPCCSPFCSWSGSTRAG